jgi:ABC-2 type transport system ATP-binding protein
MTQEDQMDHAIVTSNLSCRYGAVEALTDLTLQVETGTIFALLGPNGAGKTSTLRVLMNIIPPSSGSATVLGVDSRRLGSDEFTTIGYVSENQHIPQWMTVDQLLAFCRPLYSAWDDDLCNTLLQQFDLPRGVRIGRMSRGMRVKAALVSSLAYRPRLLVLDEPFSGLDPVVRDDLVRGVLELAGEEQWTVLISSHDLDEVERLVDTVGFIDGGRLVLSERFSDLHARFRRIDVTADEWPTPPPALPTWLGVQRSGRLLRIIESQYVEGETERRIATIAPGGVIDVQPMTLREIFIALARRQREVSR